jgi:integrase
METGAIFVNNQSKKDKKLKTPQRKILGEYPKWQMVSTHTARRSFATNHYGKLPTPVIMAATGHTTEKSFLVYLNKTAKDNALVLQEYWQKETKKQNKESSFKIIKEAN